MVQMRLGAWQGESLPIDPQLPIHCSAPPRSVTLDNHFSTGSSSLWAQKYHLSHSCDTELNEMVSGPGPGHTLDCWVGIHHLFPGPSYPHNTHP